MTLQSNLPSLCCTLLAHLGLSHVEEPIGTFSSKQLFQVLFSVCASNLLTPGFARLYIGGFDIMCVYAIFCTWLFACSPITVWMLFL